MSDLAPMEELYLGCECMDLDHVALLVHFPPAEDKKKNDSGLFLLPEEDDDDNVIFFSVSVHNFFDAIVPPIISLFDTWAWRSFFHHSWFKRFWIAGRYIVDPLHLRKFGILDAFDFQNKDLDKMDAFLSLISSAIDDNIINSEVRIDDGEWLIKFETTRLELKKADWVGPWQVGWEAHFKNRGFFGRVHYAFKYIFGQHSPEKSFTIHEKEAAKLRGMIKWVRESNKKDEQNEK